MGFGCALRLSFTEIETFDDYSKKKESLLCVVQKQVAMTRVRGMEETCISASPKEMVDLTALLARHHSRNSHSSMEEEDFPLSPASEDEHMSTDTDSPYFRPRRVRYISETTTESEGSVTEVRLLCF